MLMKKYHSSSFTCFYLLESYFFRFAGKTAFVDLTFMENRIVTDRLSTLWLRNFRTVNLNNSQAKFAAGKNSHEKHKNAQKNRQTRKNRHTGLRCV